MDVILEVGPKRRTFARVDEWPGWCRSGRDETGAMAALEACRDRYTGVVAQRDLALPKEALAVAERINGSTVTDFGALAVSAARDSAALTRLELDRFISLGEACWSAFDAAYVSVPVKRRAVKPERGRAPRDMLQHVLETDLMHLAGIAGVAVRKPPARIAIDDLRAVHALITEALAAVRPGIEYQQSRKYGFGWTPRFAVHRSAWHAIDHAWELEDRSPATTPRESRE